MQVQINTDKNVEGHERLENYIRTEMASALARFEDRITRIEIHLSDENSDKFSLDDKRCLIEARLEKTQPMAVTAHSDTTEKAFYEALGKIKKVLATHFDKIKSH